MLSFVICDDNYEINDEARANATHYGKMVIDIKANSKVVYPYSNVSKIMKNPSTFGADEWYFSAKIEGEVVVNPFSALKDGSMSAEEYFNAMYTYHKGQWDKLR